MNHKMVLEVVFCISLLMASAHAEVPSKMSYQGKLTGENGVPVPYGDYTIWFRIYTDSTGGDLLWEEEQSVNVAGGLFSVLLGDSVPIPDTVFTGPTRWLGLQVSPDPELAPRKPIVSMGYAFHSAKTDTAQYALKAPRDDDWTPDTSAFNIYRLTGNVGIGTPSPTNKLHIVGSESVPLLNVEQSGTHRGVRVYTTNACALWVEHAGNHGLRVTDADGDGIHVDHADGWAGYFNGTGYFSGNVGIGTGGPTSILHISKDWGDTEVRIEGGAINDNGDGYLRFRRFGTDRGVIFHGGALGGIGIHSGGGFPSIPHMVIKDDGNVGIGTSSPGNLLDISTDTPAHTNLLRLSNLQTPGYRAGIEFYTGSGGGSVGSTIEGSDYLIFKIGGPPLWEAMRINSNGNVGIGTDNPTNKLHVVGDIYCTGKLTSDGGNDPPYVLYNKETRESIRERVAKEVPEDKMDGAVLFWNGEDLRFEVYIPARGEFRDILGNLLEKLTVLNTGNKR